MYKVNDRPAVYVSSLDAEEKIQLTDNFASKIKYIHA